MTSNTAIIDINEKLHRCDDFSSIRERKEKKNRIIFWFNVLLKIVEKLQKKETTKK